ncbi:MAG: hypothetical protein PWQ68_2282 [Thermoanaerobacteraceae bacterium]|nr:hypothetical protein [Thermoanaerobacteraceae bacterium]
MPEQIKLNIDVKEKKEEIKDEFASRCKPLKELLDSVRGMEGFPLGKDEDILALSVPPCYTACPNPYINDFIKTYGKQYDETTDTYQRTPYVGDVSEGKNDPIYNVHSYHTKVPHKAIMKYIEHYTQEGDIVFDGFCGSGMTGVAAQLLNRRAILADLSPAATFIAYNYNTPVDIAEFEREARRILKEIEKECGWMYETIHTDGKTKGKINYTVWSDIFICPYCGNEYIFWEAAVDEKNGEVKDEYNCPTCNALISKRECERAKITFYDAAIQEKVTQAKQVPVLINYTVGKKRFEKKPDEFDLNLIKEIEESTIPYWFPTDRMPEGYNTEQPKKSHGITHVHHFYSKRNLWVMSALFNKVNISSNINKFILGAMKSALSYGTKLVKVNIGRLLKSGGLYAMGAVGGTLYIPSINAERPMLEAVKNKIKVSNTVKKKINSFFVITSTNSTTSIIGNDNSVDYIFTDPPFGSNLMYSELNFIWEAWLKVFTNNRTEAIINETQHKGLEEYKELMTQCFKEMYRILKPNRWMTVVFHNSKASVWNAIQDAITRAGFVVAQVSVMDKKQGSFKQVTSAGAVKNDLIINAYKPRKRFEESFLRQAGKNMERDFVKEHLEHLPIEPNVERTEQMLYSKTIAHYVQRGYEIRLNSREFYTLLKDNFKLIDGYWFTDDQVLKYDEWKKKQGLDSIKGLDSGQYVFVVDEKTAMIWIYNFLETPKTYSEIYTASRKAVSNVQDEIPEIKELLDNNFIFENGAYRRPMSLKEKEKIEAQREKDLARAFENILSQARTGTKRIKSVRKEALLYGFEKAYREKRFEDILTVGKKLDREIINTSGEINDFIEIALVKTGKDEY